MARPASPHAIRTAARAVIGTEVWTLSDLVARLESDGLTLGDDAIVDVADALVEEPDFLELADDRFVVLPALLDGITWVAEVPADLAEVDCVPAQPSLTLLETLAYDVPLSLVEAADATEDLLGVVVFADELGDDTPVLHGPEGWLSDAADGLAAFTNRDDQLTVAAVEPAERPAPHPEIVAALREVFEARAYSAEIGGDFDDEATVLRFTSLDDLLTEALVAARPAFAAGPVAPVDDLLAAAGLATSDGDVIDAATTWDDLDRWRGRRRIESLFDLEGSEVDEAEMVLTASYGLIEGRLRLDDFGADDPDSPGAEAAAFALALCLVKDRVARAFVGEHRAVETPPHLLADFARMLLEHLDAPEDTGVRFVLAWALNEHGDALDAEAELEQAAQGGVDLAPMLRMLAGYRADRGDAPGAMALLRRIPAAVAESDGNIELLRDEVEGYARSRPAPSAGRNEPCPCGSGRKYKTCHLGQERHPLEERSPWLYAKAVRYLRDGPSRFLSGEVATVIAEHAEGSPGSLLELLDLPLTHDIALHEGRVFADFVTERDAFLPDDEALTAAGWALVDRSVFEIESKTDDSLVLRDLRSGEHVEVVNVNASDATRIGDLVLGRPLPVGDTWRAFSGFISVPLALRDHALAVLDGEPSPMTVAGLVGACFAPPTMQNTDGHDLVFHELSYEVDDGAAAAAALRADDRLVDRGDGRFEWSRNTGGLDDAVIATFEVDDDELLVSVNSDERMAEAVALLTAMLPEARLIDHHERTAQEAMASRGRRDRVAGTPPPGMLDPDDPEVAEILRQAVEAHERRWVDEPVPALNGLTPREALDDPVERVALERLIAGMRQPTDAPGPGMDAARVRRLLGM